MEKKSSRLMSLFDELTIPDQIHTLKLFLPYTPRSSQKMLGILIRVIELHYTVQYYQSETPSEPASSSSPLHMMEELSPYFSARETDLLNTFRNMMNIMEMVQMMQAFSDSENTESSDSSDFPGFDISTLLNFFASGSMNSAGQNPADFLMGMLSPEQRETFEMYQEMFSSPEEPASSEPPENPDSYESGKNQS